MPAENQGLEGRLEEKPEKVFTREEVISAMELTDKNYEIIRELVDEKGIYRLEVKIKDEEGGGYTIYDFMRKGDFIIHQAPRTIIVKEVHDQAGNFIAPPEHIAEYNDEKGDWTKGLTFSHQ